MLAAMLVGPAMLIATLVGPGTRTREEVWQLHPRLPPKNVVDEEKRAEASLAETSLMRCRGA